MTERIDDTDLDFSHLFSDADDIEDEDRKQMNEMFEVVNTLLSQYSFGENGELKELFIEDNGADEIKIYVRTFDSDGGPQSSRLIATLEYYDEAYMFLRGYHEALFIPVEPDRDGIV